MKAPKITNSVIKIANLHARKDFKKNSRPLLNIVFKPKMVFLDTDFILIQIAYVLNGWSQSPFITKTKVFRWKSTDKLWQQNDLIMNGLY